MRNLLAASSMVVAGMALGRLLGFVRELLIASRFGAGGEADIAVALLILPDFITNALIAGAISGVLVPAFAARSEQEARQLFWQASALTLVAFGLLALLLSSQSEALLSLIIPHHAAQGAQAAAWMLWVLPVSAVTAVVTAYLQHYRRLLSPAFATVIFNAVLVAGLLFLPLGVLEFAWVIVLAGFLRLVSQALVLSHIPAGRVASRWSPWQIDAPLCRIYAAATGAALLSLIPTYAPYWFAAQDGQGGMAVFNYAFKLVLLPATVLQTVIQLVLLPQLVDIARQPQEIKTVTLKRYFMGAWVLSMALALMLSASAKPLAALCFGHGAMSQEAVDTLANLFAVGVWSLPGMVLGTLWQTALFAHGNARIAFLVSVAQSLGILLLGAWLYRTQGGAGVMLAYVIVQTLALIIYGRYQPQMGMRLRAILPPREALETLAAIAVAGAPFIGLVAYVEMPSFAAVLAAFLGGLCALAAACYISASLRSVITRR